MPIPLGILAVAGAGAAGGGSYELIESSFISSNTASITFSNLDTYASTYKHLQIKFTGRTNRASEALDRIAIRFNNDSSSSYSTHNLYGTGSSVLSFFFGASQTSINSVNHFDLFGSTEPNDRFGAGIIDILDFSNTSKNTTVRIMSGIGGGSVGSRIAISSGLFINTAAITSVTILSAFAASFVSGSRFSLYGIRG